MAEVMRPLASTVRIVEWDELPSSVQQVPADFNPLSEGILMQHQADWLRLRATIKVAEKGRRTGITFAEALGKTLVAASARSASGDNVYYIGDTKEKGLEFVGYCARFARVIAKAQKQAISAIEQFLFEDQDEQGNSRHITAYRIRFSSGFQIVALSSRPSNIRGLQGQVVIDEAAFHQDVQAVLDAVTALIIWGGSISIISSHNGRRNPFNQLVNDVRDGKYGVDAVVFRVTFDDAVKNGLYERTRMLKGEPATADDKRAWYTRIRSLYGPRKQAMREELDCIPRDGQGVCIPRVWIEEAMREERTILRLALGDDFVAMHPDERKAWCKDWIERYLKPELAKLDPQRQHVFGQDFARHRHFSTITPVEIGQTLCRRVPFAIEMHKVPTRQQEQVLWAVIDALPNFCGGGMDATGPGQTLAEYTGDRYGSAIHQINLNRQWYAAWMPKLVQGFEQRQIDIPKDASMADDIQAIEEVDGIPMVVKAEAKDTKDPDLFRHGDFGVALAIAWYATLNMSGAIDFTAAPRHARGFDNVVDSDADEALPESSAW